MGSIPLLHYPLQNKDHRVLPCVSACPRDLGARRGYLLPGEDQVGGGAVDLPPQPLVLLPELLLLRLVLLRTPLLLLRPWGRHSPLEDPVLKTDRIAGLGLKQRSRHLLSSGGF